jgi:hypothetical protein
VRRRGCLLQSSILTAALLVFAAPAFAAEPVPGGVCSTLNYIIETGGPETTGVRHILRCDGAHWQQQMTIDADGKVTLGYTQIGNGEQEYVTLQQDPWENTFLTSPRADRLGKIYFNLGTANNTSDAAFVIDGALGLISSALPFAAESAVRLSGDITPAQITANQNNYNPTGLDDASVLLLSSDASRNITGLAGGADGRIMTVVNIGATNPIVLKNENASSTAANRFALTGDLTLAAKQSAMLMYDSTASRWRQIANGTATGSGDNLGNHTATQNIVLGSNWLSGDGGNEGVRIDSSGHVFIDGPTTTGIAALSVEGETDTGDVQVIGAHADSSSGGAGIYIKNDSAISHQAQISFQNVWYVGNSLGMNTTDDFYIYNTATSSAPFVIGTDGNVGIGTTAPRSDLHIYSSSDDGPSLSIATPGTGNQQSTINLFSESNGSDTLSDVTASGWQIWANSESNTVADDYGGAGGFGIGYANNGGWNPAALVIQANGNIGIGTHARSTPPVAGFDVATSTALSGDITPAQITANQNDYNPTGLVDASVLRLSSDASRNITGLAGGADGRIMTVVNIGATNPIVLKNENASSTAANRFALTGDLTLAAKQSAMIMYDSTASRWRQVANGTAAGSGDNLGNHTATQNIVLGANYLSGDGGNEGISIDSSGKTGIGTASPATMLDVNGDITNRNVANCTQLGTDSTGKLVCQGVAIPTMALISTQTASASASLQFTGLPTTYNTMLLNCAGLLLSADAGIRVQVGQGAGPTWNTSAKYSVSSIYTATGFTGSANTYNSSTDNDLTGQALFTDTASPMSLKMYIDNISSSSIAKVATFHSSGSKDSPASSYGVYTINGMGFWNNDTNPVTAIRLITTGGTMTSGTCSLYGMN